MHPPPETGRAADVSEILHVGVQVVEYGVPKVGDAPAEFLRQVLVGVLHVRRAEAGGSARVFRVRHDPNNGLEIPRIDVNWTVCASVPAVGEQNVIVPVLDVRRRSDEIVRDLLVPRLNDGVVLRGAYAGQPQHVLLKRHLPGLGELIQDRLLDLPPDHQLVVEELHLVLPLLIPRRHPQLFDHQERLLVQVVTGVIQGEPRFAQVRVGLSADVRHHELLLEEVAFGVALLQRLPASAIPGAFVLRAVVHVRLSDPRIRTGRVTDRVLKLPAASAARNRIGLIGAVLQGAVPVPPVVVEVPGYRVSDVVTDRVRMVAFARDDILYFGARAGAEIVVARAAFLDGVSDVRSIFGKFHDETVLPSHRSGPGFRVESHVGVALRHAHDHGITVLSELRNRERGGFERKRIVDPGGVERDARRRAHGDFVRFVNDHGGFDAVFLDERPEDVSPNDEEIPRCVRGVDATDVVGVGRRDRRDRRDQQESER
mmetsp:Transcript_1272/g.3084  ORF Transcript_1272/g.3084 Transcript_1272/m.3084 type:complete len:485 (+) Transcript_1272:1269-2723(+)